MIITSLLSLSLLIGRYVAEPRTDSFLKGDFREHIKG